HLEDEYPLDDGFTGSPGDIYRDEDNIINCSRVNPCSKWSNIPSSQCLPICSSDNWFKSSEISIMNFFQERVSTSGTDFNPENYNFNDVSLINGWKKIFPDSPHATSNTSSPKLQKILDVTLTNGSSLSLKSLQNSQGYLSENQATGGKDSVKVALVDSSNNELYVMYEPLTYELTDMPTHEVFKAEELYITLPYLPSATAIKVSNNFGREILSIPLNNQIRTLSNNTKLTPICGNMICDAGFGENKNSCAIDCAPKKKTALDFKIQMANADIDKNGKVDTKDLNLLMKEYGKRQKVAGIKADINTDGKVDSLDMTIITNLL
ncbi:MAG: hypothetical protein ACMG6E_01725, partial [Candidatus Roizmanbacteria bacterium]